MQIRFIGKLYQGDGLKFMTGQHDIVNVPDEIATRLLRDNSNDFEALKPTKVIKPEIVIEPEPVRLSFVEKMIADPDSVTVKQMTKYAAKKYPELVLSGKKADKIDQIVKASGGE